MHSEQHLSQQEFEFHWETDYGMTSRTIVNGTLKAATAELKRLHPEDHGADGFVTLEDGTEKPINW
jgi:hypothetical protein